MVNDTKQIHIANVFPGWMDQKDSDAFPYSSIEAARDDLARIIGSEHAGRWASWIWDMAQNGELAKATAVIFDIITKFVSICKGPAVESSTWLMKTKDMRIETCGKKYVEYLKPVPGIKNTITTYNDKAIFACVLEPNITDDKGELYPPWEVEKTAHLFLKDYGQMDNHHDYIPGAGEIIESWVPKEEIRMQTLSGEARVYQPFSWFLGFEPSPYESDLIENGDRDGLSIGGEWPKIIFGTPGVKTMDDLEKLFFSEMITKNQEKTSDMLKQQAEQNKELIKGVTDGIAEGLKPLSDIKTVVDKLTVGQKDAAPAADAGAAAPPPSQGAPPAPAAAPAAAPAPGTQAPLQAGTQAPPATTAAPPAQGTPAPAADAGAGTTTNQDAQGQDGGQGAAQASAPDGELPDQKVARLQLAVDAAKKDAKIRSRAVAGAGAPTDGDGDDNMNGVVTDVKAAWLEHQKLGAKAKVTRG